MYSSPTTFCARICVYVTCADGTRISDRHPAIKTYPCKKIHVHHLSGYKGVLYTEFLTKGWTVNSDRCCATLQSLKQRIRRIRPEGNTFLLNHDNARPHCSAQTQDAMTSLKFTVVPHPPLQPRLGTVRLLVVPKIEGDFKRSTFFIGCRS